jgi:hypothetical protein
MNIGDYGQTSFSADFPQFCERITVKNADAGVVSVGIEIVVVDDSLYFTSAVPLHAEEKRARLILPSTATTKFPEQLRPQCFRAA